MESITNEEYQDKFIVIVSPPVVESDFRLFDNRSGECE